MNIKDVAKIIREIIFQRRSIRRFHSESIPYEDLIELVDVAHVAPSSANKQPLEYLIVDDPEMVNKIFPLLRWAGYITPKGNPPPSQRPTAYIIVLANKKISKNNFQHDAGAAIENLLLLAQAKGFGTCWIGSIERKKMATILKTPLTYYIDSVIALGYPAEKPILEETKDDIKYWLDKNGQLHVPKRKLKDIIHHNFFRG